jgi:hypothetical protein
MAFTNSTRTAPNSVNEFWKNIRILGTDVANMWIFDRPVKVKGDINKVL